jgi:hypothetical protein
VYRRVENLRNAEIKKKRNIDLRWWRIVVDEEYSCGDG